MAHENYADPLHRLENLSKGAFFRAYAELHETITSPDWADKPISDLRAMMVIIDYNLAHAFDIRMSTLQGKLVDTARSVIEMKDRQDQAE